MRHLGYRDTVKARTSDNLNELFSHILYMVCSKCIQNIYSFVM